MYTEPVKCSSCGNTRIPETRIEKQGRKKWLILKCRICHQQDIEPYVPVKLWNGLKFVEDPDDNDSFLEEN